MTTKSLPILHEYAERVGADRKLNYVSDLWGSEPGVMTPNEAINLHKRIGWTDEDYTIVGFDLCDQYGNSILEL